MIDIPDSFLPKDAQGNLVCPKCQKTTAQCDCPSFDPTKPKADKFKPLVRLDKSGRKGKIVTLIQALPRDEAYLKDLSKTIKVKTGAGGTFYLDDKGGVIEVQGDHQEAVARMLQKEKFQR